MSLDEQDKHWIVANVLEPVLNEMGVRFGEVNARLDRMDATITVAIAAVTLHGRQMAAGARAIAGWNDWTVKADEDYKRVLAELAELKTRLDRLEGK